MEEAPSDDRTSSATSTSEAAPPPQLAPPPPPPPPPLPVVGVRVAVAEAVRDTDVGTPLPPMTTLRGLASELAADVALAVSSVAGPSDVRSLQALVTALRCELGTQASELARGREGLATAERERVHLAQALRLLVSEREEAKSRLAEARARLASLDDLHTQERKDDTQLFQSNLQRLLADKARLVEEVEEGARQKDVLTEALARVHQELRRSQRLNEERGLIAAQHSEVTERLQSALSERDKARAELQTRDKQLEATRGALAAHARGVERLRAELEAVTVKSGAVAARARRDETERYALAAELIDVERAWAAAFADAHEVRSLRSAEVSACLGAISEADQEAAEALSTARTQLALADGARLDAEAARSALAAFREVRDAKASLSVASREQSESQLRQLSAERDSYLAELAAQKRISESLRSELKKALQRAQPNDAASASTSDSAAAAVTTAAATATAAAFAAAATAAASTAATPAAVVVEFDYSLAS